VIDQPEDNLDNQLITELLIHTLHDLKERRQVIVITHNPNIVVTGDAEQVVVMEFKDGKCQVRRQASIDKPAVMRDVVELMEGGEEALRRRFRRYWPNGEMPSFLLASK
jgi:predicted ATPase